MSERITILGAGESGTGAAILAHKKGYSVWVSDSSVISEKYKQELLNYNIPFEEGKHSVNEILASCEVIKSPGISDKADIILQIKNTGIPVISEIEFAGRYTDSKKICVTGTDGKTTTSSLIFHIMKHAGLHVSLAGNIGNSFARQVALEEYDYYVLEISSFQLDGMFDFRADIAVITNIEPDHLDRYEYQLEKYIASKFRITRNQTESDHLIFCYDSENIIKNMHLNQGKAQQYMFSCIEKTLPGAYQQNGKIYINSKPNIKPDFIMNQHDLPFRGRHNAYNAMAAGISADVLEISSQNLRESFSDFQSIEHRLEPVLKIGGIEYINDSKATNVNAAWFALESIESKIIWIAGGQDKGNDYTKLKQLVREKVRFIICIGNDNRKIHEAFSSDVEMMINAGNMQEAVQLASQLALKGDTVLLSPACASFDRFSDYQERGRLFKKAVRNL